ncbi:MAG TPA: lytic transglycosylase domain-containing protein [Acidiferrobacteraceae bacterium]|nr:lytic transglycosylase domain-containing protein [Acidiferrobacteraceae bacterium]HEX19856.1 lytic transglycosylase domain-containing protein [Acidiferrobacteraceae bacterium]
MVCAATCANEAMNTGERGAMIRQYSRYLVSSLILFSTVLLCNSVSGTLYVYKAPDGSRIVSDHALGNKSLKLMRATQSPKVAGQLLAKKAPKQEYSFRRNHKAYDTLIKQASIVYSVDPALVKAIMRVESAFNPRATSHKGAAGLMQLMPATAEEYGVEDIYNPEENVYIAVRHIKYLLRRYKYNTRLVAAAYNAGERAVHRYRGVPPYRETRDYVRKVIKYRRIYRRSISL